MSTTPWWVNIVSVALTGLLALLAQQWAARGKKVVDTSTLALDMVEKLTERVESLEKDRDWHVMRSIMDGDYIALLRDWIYRGQPPPPPERPIYPPRPS